MKQINEQYLYDILKCLAQADAPLVFKGALLTKIITKDNKYSIERMTQDLDADWNGEILPITDLEQYLNNILSNLRNVKVSAFRDYGNNRSAGFYVYVNDENIASIDIDMRGNEYYKIYEIDGVKFYGSSVDKIFSDKIYVLSTNRIFRRTKDLIDLYMLSSMAEINVTSIRNIYRSCNKSLEDFDALFNRKDEIEHAYNLLRRVTNKPPFVDVYDCCVNIAKLFL